MAPRRTLRLAGTALLAALCGHVASAQELYVCTVNGHTISGQLPPQECKNSEVRVLNPDGTLKKTLPAPRNADQIRRDQQAEEARQREEDEKRKEAREDRALLETYSSLDEIEAARKRDLGGQQILVDRAEGRINQYKKEKKHLDDEAEFYAKHEMPRRLKDAFTTNQTLTEQQEKARADALAKMTRINKTYDEKHLRFEEIERAAREAEEARRKAEAGSQ
jgi:hypothetical protein